MLNPLNTSQTQKLNARLNSNLLRVRIKQNPRELSFISTDYLNLSKDPRVIHAFNQAAQDFGIGTGASPLLGGHTLLHEKLEDELSQFTKFSRTILFPTGYMANLALVSTLIQANNLVFFDRLNHASLYDGLKLSGANFFRYNHQNFSRLEKQLEINQASQNPKNTAIFSEGLFGLNGDILNIHQLLSITQKYKSQIMIDDAHGLGLLGKKGRGILEIFNVDPRNITALVGSLSKAFGLFGGFISGSAEVIELLIQFARPYLYTTSLPIPIVNAARESLKIIINEHWRREHCEILGNYFQKQAMSFGFKFFNSNSNITTAIQPIRISKLNDALLIQKKLADLNIMIGVLKPPTIPLGSEGIRINFSVKHERTDVERLLDALYSTKKFLSDGCFDE